MFGLPCGDRDEMLDKADGAVNLCGEVIFVIERVLEIFGNRNVVLDYLGWSFRCCFVVWGGEEKR